MPSEAKRPTLRRAQRVRITEGIPHGWLGRERVRVSLPPSVTGDKGTLHLMIRPDEFAVTANQPQVCWVSGSASYWLYRRSVFVAFGGPDGSMVKQMADQLLNPAPASTPLWEQKPAASRSRKPIPRQVKIDVWQRDGGCCVDCGSNENLEFDHIIPVAKGGANTFRNLQLLCEPCNRTKGHRI